MVYIRLYSFHSYTSHVSCFCLYKSWGLHKFLGRKKKPVWIPAAQCQFQLQAVTQTPPGCSWGREAAICCSSEDVFSSYTGLTLQEIKTSALSCRIPSELIWIQGSDFLNCAIPPEKLLDSDPKKKNVFSTMQCHISLFINHFLNLIIQKVVSEQLTTSTALARILLRWWKACPLATPERFNILYFPKSRRLCEEPTVHSVTRTPAKPQILLIPLFQELQFSEVVTCVSKFGRE